MGGVFGVVGGWVQSIDIRAVCLDLEKNGLSKLNDNRRVCIMHHDPCNELSSA